MYTANGRASICRCETALISFLVAVLRWHTRTLACSCTHTHTPHTARDSPTCTEDPSPNTPLAYNSMCGNPTVECIECACADIAVLYRDGTRVAPLMRCICLQAMALMLPEPGDASRCPEDSRLQGDPSVEGKMACMSISGYAACAKSNIALDSVLDAIKVGHLAPTESAAIKDEIYCAGSQHPCCVQASADLMRHIAQSLPQLGNFSQDWALCRSTLSEICVSKSHSSPRFPHLECAVHCTTHS